MGNSCISNKELEEPQKRGPKQYKKSRQGGDGRQTSNPIDNSKKNLLDQRLPGTGDDNQVPVTNTFTSLASQSANGEDQTFEENPTASQSTDSPQGFHEWIKRFNDIEAEKNIDALIPSIEKVLQNKKQKHNPDKHKTSPQGAHQIEEERLSTSSITTGSKFLNYIKDFVNKKGFHEGIKGIAEILQQVAKVNTIFAWLSMVGYLLSTSEKVIDNQTECLNLLERMIELAKHVKHLKNMIPQEKFNKAIEFMIQGSITCYSQLESQTLLRATVNSEALSSIHRGISDLISYLALAVAINNDAHMPRYVPPKKPINPSHAVGIEKPVKDVLGLLEATENSSLAVIIYGFGGIGKSTLAKAVAAKMNLDDYNYTSINIYDQQEKNDITRLQQRILKYCFPTYNSGKPTVISTPEEGRDMLVDAFPCEKEKPIFLFIDNVFGSYDLTQLLPSDLTDLPKGSRILVTTRTLAATDMFQQHSLERKSYPLTHLSQKDALKILFQDPSECDEIGEEYLGRILKICSGVPLALEIFRDQLQKNKNVGTRCDSLLKALESGGEIKAEQLSDRLLKFVYDDLEEYSQEAFLDICCFSLNNWKLQDVMYVVGADAVIPLLETGLITSTAKHNDYGTMYFDGEEELIVPDIIAARGRTLGKDKRIISFSSFNEAADEEKLGKIEGVWLVDDTPEHPLEEEQLNLMKKSLRVLALGERITVTGTSSENFEKLRFLHIEGNITQLPVKLEALKNLTVFHGPFSDNGEVTLCKLPPSLLAMEVMEQADDMESEYSEMEGALQCCQLEKLYFTGLKKLRQLPQGSTSLHALKTFKLDDFSTMDRLPEQICQLFEQICQLPALSVLSITKSSSLEYLPKSFGQLTNLKQLRLSDFSALKALPSTFSKFRALTHLDLEGCCTLEAVPRNLTELVALTHLSLSGCKSLEILPSNFGHLTALKYLNLSFCENLQALPPTFGHLSTLKHLCLRHCGKLHDLSRDFGQLTTLEYLNLCCCLKLEILSFDLGDLVALYHLECSLDFKNAFGSQIREELFKICSK